jgi:oxalate decarboxylase/phosphoglucose isomerase-like protein (cupin superfamily)
MDKVILPDTTFEDLDNYHLQTLNIIQADTAKNIHKIHVVDKTVFPALQGVTSYQVEIWEDCMRLPHWHPNASELGYVLSGAIEVFIWRSPGETAVFTVSAGMCYFIPQAALHSLNNVSKEHAKLVIGFSQDIPQDIDLPVAFNGLPLPVRDAYTSPHLALHGWTGVIKNPLCGKLSVMRALHEARSASPYGFDFQGVPPLFSDASLGSVSWGVKNNWSLLEGMSVLRARLNPGAARDAIWYPDAGTLYIVSKGMGEFHIIMPNHEPKPIQVSYLDYIFIPVGVLHTFINTGKEDFEVIAFLSKADPLPEVSLSVSTAFFPERIRQAALNQYAGVETKMGDILKHMRFGQRLPYILPVKKI